jgi:hypothetical protein
VKQRCSERIERQGTEAAVSFGIFRGGPTPTQQQHYNSAVPRRASRSSDFPEFYPHERRVRSGWGVGTPAGLDKQASLRCAAGPCPWHEKSLGRPRGAGTPRLRPSLARRLLVISTTISPSAGAVISWFLRSPAIPRLPLPSRLHRVSRLDEARQLTFFWRTGHEARSASVVRARRRARPMFPASTVRPLPLLFVRV